MGYRDVVIADGASNYWRLGEPSGTSAADEVGGATGTISGPVTLNQPGALVGDSNTAFLFTASTSAKATMPTAVLPLVFSLEAWIKIAAVDTDYRSIFNNRGGSWFPMMLAVRNGRLLTYMDQGTPAQVDHPTVLTAGTWYHVVLVSDGSTSSMYLNGGSVFSTAQTRGGTPLTAVAAIGGNPLTAFQDQWAGTLDEVAIYPLALTPAKILAHYNAGMGIADGSALPWWLQLGDDPVRYNVWHPITPSDTVDLPRGLSHGIYVGTAGNVAAVMQNGTAVVIAMPAGGWLPIAAKRINSTSTTATGLVALYEN